MKLNFRWALSVAAFVLVAIPFSSFALPMNARSIIYFDAQDHIIGQQILFCNNVAQHAGVVDPGNANRIEEDTGCDDRTVSCSIDSAGAEVCTRTGIENSYTVSYFHSALGYTISQYCSMASSSNAGPFFQHPGCGMPAPAQIPHLNPYVPGFAP